MGTRRTQSDGSRRTAEERRGSRRRRLAFVKSAVLEVGSRSHLVALADLAPEGAFLKGAVDQLENEDLKLRLMFPQDSRQVTIPCRLVRQEEAFDAASGRPAGVAVRFESVEPKVLRLLEEFAAEGGHDVSPVTKSFLDKLRDIFD